MTSVKKNFAFNILLVISNIVFPVLVFPYIARILGPQGLGNAHFALQFSKYFVTTASLGIPIYGLREVARIKNNKPALNKLVSELVLLNLFTALISTLVYIVVLWNSNTLLQSFPLFAIGALQVAMGFLSIDWLFAGLEDFKIITIRSLCIRFITVLFLIWFVRQPEDVLPYLLISVLSIVAGHLWNLFYALTRIKFVFSGLAFKRHFKPIVLIFLMNVCITMYTVFDTAWVGFLSTGLAVGMYTSSIKLSKIGIQFVSALGTVLLPRSARTFAENDTNPSHLQAAFNFVVDLAVPLAVGLILLAPELLRVFSGVAFTEAAPAMQILSILPLCIGLSNLFGMQILSASGHDKQLLISVFAGMVINIVLNLWLIPLWSYTGAAVAITATELAVTLITFGFAYLRFRITFNYLRMAKALLLSLFFVPITWLCKQAGAGQVPLLIFCFVACTGVYTLLQWWIFKNEFVYKAMQVFKDKIGS